MDLNQAQTKSAKRIVSMEYWSVLRPQFSDLAVN